LKEGRLRRETLVSLCSFTARGPVGTFRGRVRVGVGFPTD
jgi:hypothetical protein